MTRAKGKKRFLALWTITMTVAYFAADSLKELWEQSFDAAGLPLKLVVYLAVNLIFGAIVWRESERAYQRHLNARPQPERPISTPEA